MTASRKCCSRWKRAATGTSTTRCAWAASSISLNRSRVEKEFEERVVADAPQRSSAACRSIIDWLVDQDFRQWQAIPARLADEPAGARRPHARARPTPAASTPTARGCSIRSAAKRSASSTATIGGAKREQIADAARDGGRRDGSGRRRRRRAGRDRYRCGVDGRRRRHRPPDGGRVAALGFLIIPARRRKARAEMREKVSALWPSQQGARLSVRPCPGAQRAAIYRCRRPVRPLRAGRGRALAATTSRTHRPARPRRADSRRDCRLCKRRMTNKPD